MKKLITILLIISLILGCSSCKSIPDKKNPVPNIGSENIAETETNSKPSFPVTIIDSAGRTVTIEKEPQRIISGYYIASSMLLSLGQKDKLVGIEAKADSRNIYKLSAPQIINLPSVGTAKSFDIELSVSLKPDLVVLPMKLVDSAETLEKIGISAIVVNPETESDMFQVLEMIGKACGTERYVDILEFYNNLKNDILSSVETVNPKTVYMAGNSSYLKTAGKNMFQNTFLKNSGALNVAESIEDNYWSEISYEQLLSFDPDTVILASDREYEKSSFVSDEVLSKMRCIKSDDVFCLPNSLEAWDSPVPGSILGSAYIASCLYPDLYSFENYRIAVQDFYGTFYGLTDFNDITF